MEFRVNSRNLEKLLSKVIPAIPSKTPMTILTNFLFDINDGLLTVYATDLEVSIKSQMDIASDKNKQFVVPAKLLFDTIREFPDTIVTISLENNQQLKLKTDRGTYNLNYFETKDYPEIPVIESGNEIIISADDLNRAFNITSFAASDEDIRPAMTGILLDFAEDGLRFVATDGHRLVKYLKKSYQTELLERYIIPRKAIHIISKFLTDSEVKINLTKNLASFKFSDIELVTKLISDKYPNYNSVIPLENENLLTINRADLLSTIRRMMVFATEGNKQIKLNINSTDLSISIENVDTSASATETIDCEYNGEPMVIGFNVFYLNDIVTHIDSEKLIFKLHSPTKACLIEPGQTSENEEILMLLMPVRLNN
ncbi:MAG: DNA polymerase III subunit beta [Ignavibacterium sp.]|nr:DNA polymerase III subunit beta [Ignavibacterium sp.]MDW8376004.1 DNA polymerase III subunit beta [Ignavibacteriales bacterium]